ncbi:MAG: ATP-binding SpoIIE family protein phosphatase [Pseudomonadota bacterium]
MTTALPVADASYVASARREVEAVAKRIGLSEADRARAGLVATELATNLARHGGGGELLVQPLQSGTASGIELIAIDRGPGIANLAESMRDGCSTYGSAGTGLGAIRRQSEVFDIYSLPGRGTAILARLWPQRRLPREMGAAVGGVSVPKREELVCGDSMDVLQEGTTVSLIVADGLGHGVLANAAAEEACRLFRSQFHVSPAMAIQRIHAGLRSTRGAAVGIVNVNFATSKAVFCGIGNIAGLALAGTNVRRFVSMNGIAGHTAGRIQEFIYPCDGPGLVVVLHSDGISSNWSFDRTPGLAARQPSLIAAVLLRDAGRGRDDATVLVLKRTP